MQDDEFEFHEVDRGRWDDPEGLFNSRGGPKYCWCMVWRTMPAGVSRGATATPRKRRCGGGSNTAKPSASWVTSNGAAAGWCSVARRDSYRALGGPADAAGEGVWSIG